MTTSKTKAEKRTWDIRQEPTTVILVFGANEPESALRVQYRPQGSRGRFHVFMISGALPKGRTMQEIVTAYNARSGPQAWR